MWSKISVLMSWVWAAIWPTIEIMLTTAGKAAWSAAVKAVDDAESQFPGEGQGSNKFKFVSGEVLDALENAGLSLALSKMETIIQVAVTKITGK